ncbi:hypothetical protein ACFS7Z_24275 [Pontibacter toksunensis]|uniref:Uncharacterized protein n=1 Tax=Pontibacter toksunensis TaxID=1332631 RepID=A0ABW6C262_9BACT
MDSINDLLLKELIAKYPKQEFEELYGKKGIMCKEFTTQNVILTILPSDVYWRIAIQLEYTDYKFRKNVYDTLEVVHRGNIESKFPAGTVYWGGQMKRIKIDIYKTKYPDFFKSNSAAVKNTMEHLKAIETGIISLIPRHEVQKRGSFRL